MPLAQYQSEQETPMHWWCKTLLKTFSIIALLLLAVSGLVFPAAQAGYQSPIHPSWWAVFSFELSQGMDWLCRWHTDPQETVLRIG